MIAITSISPKHANQDIQAVAVKSWVDAGMKVYSLNHPEEVEAMKDAYPDVTFVPTHRTMERLFKKKYVAINAMLDFAKDQPDEDVVLINSDIQLYPGTGDIFKNYFATKANDAIGIIRRVDYTNEFADGKIYEYGIDVFIVKKKHLTIWPQSIYCMGQTWWDYWIPYTALRHGMKIFLVNERVAFHKLHPAQYSGTDWMKMTRYFQWEWGLPIHRTPSKTTGAIHSEIFKHVK